MEFNISKNGEDYADLLSSYLYVKVQITKSDGSTLPVDELVTPVNKYFEALFLQVDINLNERAISSSSNTYPFRAYIETLLNYGEDAKKSLLGCECFYKDKNLTETGSFQMTNAGFKKCYELIKNSKTFDMIGPLHRYIFQQNSLLLNMVDLTIKMTCSKSDSCLIAKKDLIQPFQGYKVILEHASVFVRKV